MADIKQDWGLSGKRCKWLYRPSRDGRSHDDRDSTDPAELGGQSARLESVTEPRPPPAEESAELDRPQREVIAQMVRQGQGMLGWPLTGSDGLLKALTAQVVEAAFG